MSFLHGHASYDAEDDTVQRRGSRLLGSLSRFGRRRSSLSLRKHELPESDLDDNTRRTDPGFERNSVNDPARTASPGAIDYATDDEDDNDDAASIFSTDDESVVFTDDGQDDEHADDADADDEDFDVDTLKNTLFNAHSLRCGESGLDCSTMTNYEDEDLLDPAADEFQTAPNIVYSRDQQQLESQRNLFVASDMPVSSEGRSNLITKGPLFAKNRCTMIMEYGEFHKAAAQTQRRKRYVVASDGSEGSQYAINWAMGTVLRDGDEILIVSVMETETKLDQVDDLLGDTHRNTLHQRMRQDMAVLLSHQAFVLLQRTRLSVKVSCQAIHARNARHMLLSLIDFYSPTMVIVGSRGIETIRGVLGSMSHYLVQKSSVPVMVAHNKLQLPRLPRGKADVVNNVRMRHMRLDQASTEKQSNAADHNDEQDEEDSSQDETKAAASERQHAERQAERNRQYSERMERLNRKSYERRKDHTVDDLIETDPETGLAPAIQSLSMDGDQVTVQLANKLPSPGDSSS
ncbi:hypothetical protein MPSI1_004006 [Malassezia psittaci]|uniref:UspA domain-containing protein n=1 Tax=Malassezia psittaci TaxID=1821823 RepID=A0AAF0FEM3_9BASI|nr:hypothetical protein MPSI1_004006 [Malassezia psittaci]